MEKVGRAWGDLICFAKEPTNASFFLVTVLSLMDERKRER